MIEMRKRSRDDEEAHTPKQLALRSLAYRRLFSR